MKNPLKKAVPAWHAEAVTMLHENFNKIHTAFIDATKRAVWMGLFLNHVKARGKEDGSIPHGQFEPWLERNVNHIHRDTIKTYMRLANGVCEKGKFQIAEFSTFCDLGHLPPQLEKMIEGKTQQQLFLEFKQCEDGVNPKRGRLIGEGGATKLQRVNAAQKEHEATLIGRRHQIEQFGDLADELSNDAASGDPELREAVLLAMPKVENLFRYWQRLTGKR